MKPSVLLVDDEPSILYGYTRYLENLGYKPTEAGSLSEARKKFSAQSFDAVILDMMLPDGNSIDLIEEIKESSMHTAVVVVTGKGNIEVAVDAMRRGADNFLTKPIDLGELNVFLTRCIELSTLRKREFNRLRLLKKFEPCFGVSLAMEKVMELSRVAASNDSPLLIQGETGSGKGVLARWVHDNSSLSSATFVDVNCSALHGELLASELFGHARGAFTSAVKERQGLVEVANGGTLFLDEIGDMDISVQAQFLKVIEEKTYRRLGETSSRRSVFRLICATNRDLREETKKGRFRDDLYFRINVFPVTVPPLRDRPEDLADLVEYMLGLLGSSEKTVHDDVMELLVAYGWPGNVRELKNMLERAHIISRGRELLPEHFPGLCPAPTRMPPAAARTKAHLEGEDKRVMDTLERADYDMREAASSLGISRATLYRRLKKIREAR